MRRLVAVLILFISGQSALAAKEYCIVDIKHCAPAAMGANFNLEGGTYNSSFSQFGEWNFVGSKKDYCSGPVCSGVASCEVSYKDCSERSNPSARVYLSYATANTSCAGKCPKNIEDCVRDQTADATDTVGFKNNIPEAKLKPANTLTPRGVP